MYIEETTGTIKKLSLSDCKMKDPLKKASRVSINKMDARIKDLVNHLGYINDIDLVNTILMIIHGKILSIYNFKTLSWNHIFP